MDKCEKDRERVSEREWTNMKEREREIGESIKNKDNIEKVEKT